MKMLLNMDRLTPTNTLHHNLNILKVQDVFNCNFVNFVNDILIKRCPDVFYEYFVLKQNTYDLRTKSQVVVPPARIPFGDRHVRIKGAQLWNNLPKCMLNDRLKNSFKINYKKICCIKV